MLLPSMSIPTPHKHQSFLGPRVGKHASIPSKQADTQ